MVDDNIKDEVKKQIEDITPQDKKEVKKELEQIKFDKQVNTFFYNLTKTQTKEERQDVLTKNKSLINKLSQEQDEELLEILNERESEDWDNSFVTNDDDLFEGIDVEKLKQEIDNYRQRKAQEDLEEKERQRIINIQITEQQLEQAIKEAEASKKLTIKDEWMKLFNKISFENEIAGEILFHSFVGQMLNHVTIYDKRGKKILMKVDFFWIQNSSSGKGEGIDEFFKPLLNEFDFEKADNETQQTLTVKFKYSTFRGQSSLAGILNRYKRDSTGRRYTGEIIIGPIESSDFWIWTEANELLTPNTYSQKLIDAMLDLMEGKEYETYLEKYDRSVKTKGHGSLIAASRPVENIDYFLIKSGLIHRCLLFMRSLSVEKMTTMIDKGAIQSFGSIEDGIGYDLEIKKLANEMRKIANWSTRYIGQPYPIKNPDLLNALMKKKLDELLEDVKKDVQVKNFQDVLVEYVGRLKNKAIALSYHNATIRKEPVDVQDVLGAFNLIKLSFNNFKYWLFENIEIKKGLTEKDTKLFYLIKSEIKRNHGEVTLKDLKKTIEARKDLQLSGTYIYRKVKDMIEMYNDDFVKTKNNTIILKHGKHLEEQEYDTE